ncbi:flagellar hook-length control protein FliK [Paenibacillus sp. GCM10023248]|uniref:flagellar hook-length control protein FliK n=1 Tax=unclassified Paenibacillus TaxID=185978 RepID=UPI002379E79F|nr:flagellar hook-length control protein FliK [Paenibacillus sp. MAHUQ-63]MDD9270288.1 flagellar hook-length control protein FliK [Paenibacillus sp. MAHUQ-63]
MDVQIQAVPTGTSATASASKTNSANAATADGFSQALGDQLAQDQTAGDMNAADPALSLDMLLQMLQSLVMPVSGAVVQDTATEEQSLPEAVIDAMNGNPALAEQLLQDPGVKQWFADAQQLLQSFAETSAPAGLVLTNSMKMQGTELTSLQAQNTLLTLASLSKQQPENPILNFLMQDLQETIKPLLTELMTSGKAQPLETATVVSAPELMEDGKLKSNKKEAVSADKVSHHKQAGRKSEELNTDGLDSYTIIQPTKSKLEVLALRNVLQASFVETASTQEESQPALVDFPTEVATTANTVVTAGDLQKAQLTPMTADKAASATINASNFAEEMTAHVLKNMKVTVAEGFSEAKLSLFPKNLGHIDVKISMHDGQLIAQFAADSLAAKQMLENQLPQLRQALLTQGLQVEKLEVTQTSNMQSSMFQEQRQQQAFSQSQRQNKNGSGSYKVESLDFDQEAEQVAQVRTSVNGNSFDVTA